MLYDSAPSRRKDEETDITTRQGDAVVIESISRLVHSWFLQIGRTPLHNAVLCESKEVCSLLLSHGANIEAIDMVRSAFVGMIFMLVCLHIVSLCVSCCARSGWQQPLSTCLDFSSALVRACAGRSHPAAPLGHRGRLR